MSFSCGSDGKESTCNAGDLGLIPGSRFDSWIFQEDPLEKEMATHSSILAWIIPWTKEPSGLQSIGLHRVGQNSGTNIELVKKVPTLSRAGKEERWGYGRWGWFGAAFAKLLVKLTASIFLGFHPVLCCLTTKLPAYGHVLSLLIFPISLN